MCWRKKTWQLRDQSQKVFCAIKVALRHTSVPFPPLVILPSLLLIQQHHTLKYHEEKMRSQTKELKLDLSFICSTTLSIITRVQQLHICTAARVGHCLDRGQNIHTYKQRYKQTYKHTHIHTNIHTYTNTHMQTYIQTSRHTYMYILPSLIIRIHQHHAQTFDKENNEITTQKKEQNVAFLSFVVLPLQYNLFICRNISALTIQLIHTYIHI